MGSNLAQLFRQLADMPDEVIQELHPAHTAASVRELLPRFKHFANGTCIVHHIFGGETCELVRQVGGRRGVWCCGRLLGLGRIGMGLQGGDLHSRSAAEASEVCSDGAVLGCW